MSHLFLLFIKIHYTGMPQLCCKFLQRIILKKIRLFEKILFVYLFGHWLETLRPSGRKCSKWLSKPNSTCLWDSLWGNFFGKKKNSWSILEIHRKNFRHFVKMSSAVLPNCILLVRRTFWVEKFLIEGTGFCWLTSGKEQKAISFLSNFS